MAQDTYIDEMTIYNPSGKAIYDAPVTTSAIIKYALMGDYYIELPFSLLTPLDFPLGSYITYKGRKFEIMSEVYPDFDNKTGGYKYTLQFQAQQNHMKNFICFWLGGDNPEAVFHNTTDLASFGALIVANMNKALGGNNWQMGSVNVEHPETNKLVSFNGDTCWDALSSIAETFDVEWWTEENGSIVTLHFGKLNFGTPETFKRGEVVKSIPAKKGDDSEYGTRFYVFGSTRNLTKEYGQSEQGGVTNHVSEVRLRLPDGQQYIDARPGLTKNEIKEVVVFFDDIYPKNTETVTSVETIDRTIIEGQTDKAYVMVCNDTPFLPSDVIEGETLGAHFTSGDLIGWDFELALIDDNGDNIDPATWKPEDGFNKKFEIIAQVETSGESQQIIPNENMRPRGKDDDRGPDTFVLTGVKLPQQRIDEAEQELLNAGTSYAAKHSSDTTVYDCETNPVYCTHNEKNYEAGQAVRLMGPQFGIDGRLSRIQGYEKKLYNEYIATYTVGDNTPYSRLGSIESDVKASLYSQRIGIAENGAAIYLITRYDNTFPTDTNAYSARRAIWEFANKQAPDTFKGRMTFNAGAQFGPSYASGITGVGGFINEKGAGELESLFIRRFLEVPELRYNRVGISVGDDWSAPGAGVIESVDKDQKLVTLKLEEGEIGAVAVGDICMGIFHDFDPSNNATADSDDGRGNRTFAGFATVYFRITEVLGDRNERFRYELRPLSATFTKQLDPMESMTFVAYGSFTNPARRSSRYSTRTYQRYLRNVSDWEFTAENIAAQFGDLTNLSVFGIQMSGYSAYLDNIYLQGMVSSLDKKVLLDTRSKLFRMVGDNGVGVAFTPEAGWKQGKLYDPATGQFQKEFDIEQIDQTAREAAQAAATAQQDANAAAADVSSLKNFTDEAFADGVISRAEASSIEKYTNSVEETQRSADASYTTVYNNSLLSGTAKSNLQAAKSTFDTAVADLLSAIRTASDDGIATPEEKAGVDSQYALFNDAYSAFCTRLEEANEYIQTAINTAAQGAYQLSQELQGVVNNINETIIPDLQDQIDKSIISWGGEEVPTLDNYPASEWTTDTERKRHINDGYDRKITTDGAVSYESYKFVFENGVYQWNRIADSGSATAIAEARKALGLAGTKARVFYGSATPSVPYEVNDVWFRTSGSGSSLTTTLYISNADKGDGETASADDWQLVDDSQVRLRQMSSDQVISREEKAVLRNTLAQMQKEFAAYQSDADTYGISITALSTAYNSLVNFLTGTVAVNNDTDTTLTQSQRTDYNTRFAAYTSEVARFSNLIADAISQGKVDGLQFGARNYIAKVYISDWNNNSQGKTDIVLTGSDTDGSYQSVNYRAVQEIISSGDSTRADIFRGRIKFQENMQYSFKVRWKLLYEMSSTVRGMYFVFIYTDGTMEFVPIYGNQTSLVETVYSTKEGKTLDRISASYSQFDAGGKTNRVLIYDIQLTEGNKAPTGYITAEEDVQAQIEQVKLDVDYIASDSSLTPSDKQQVANEWVRIQNEYWSIIANAAKYDVPADTFTTYFQRLEDYLAPLLADMSTTSEITGTEFRDVFADYYQLSGNMSDLIDDAIDESIKSTEYLKKAMEDGSTEVKGGLIMTNVMLLKNAEGDVTAGVSGLQEDDVPFWSGADYTNRKKAVFRVHADGEVHATKGTVGILQVKNDSVEVSDAAASGNKIILTTNNINSVSQVLGSSKVPSSQTTESIAVITSQTKPFASDSRNSSQFKCGAEVQMSAQVKGTIRGGGSVKIEIINRTADTTDTIFRQSSAYDDTGSIQINKNIRYRFTTPAYYYIKVTVEASYPGGLGNAASAAVEAITFSFVTDVRKNLIAPNGVAVVKGSSNYAIFTGDIFEVRIGNGGLRIQNGKVYKTNSGTGGWTEI
ncbi:hypothetical protein [Alistipes putredinis]|jgi:hypothetical protein|uniref:hypothetical protein n=1 Tax=Alistipes putredinis TaxID=28117 RepID=UPI0024316535|nr:hypothetical protein [Alistipes putredinis]